MSKLVYFLIPVGILLSGVSIINSQKGTPNLPDLGNISDHLSTLSANPPSNLEFCGEIVPLAIPSVKTRMDNELEKNVSYHAAGNALIKRASRYQRTFTTILKKNGIPSDFFYLAVAESHLTNAISHRGARGFWQFMQGAGRHYGLEISSTVDERFHPEKATEAAAKYLKDEYRQFKDWSLVAAAYNMGSPKLKRAIKRQQADSYYELDLNRETSRYLFRILAMKSILKTPLKYGFSTTASYAPVKTYSVRVSSSISDLEAFAHENGSTYRMLKLLNPWLISDHLDATPGKTYRIQFPHATNPQADELIVQGTTLPDEPVVVTANPEDIAMVEVGDSVAWE